MQPLQGTVHGHSHAEDVESIRSHIHDCPDDFFILTGKRFGKQVCARLLKSSVCTAEDAGSVAKPQAVARGHSAVTNLELGGSELVRAIGTRQMRILCAYMA